MLEITNKKQKETNWRKQIIGTLDVICHWNHIPSQKLSMQKMP